MLWSFEHLRGYALRATDGTLGDVKDMLFDDSTWTVRYFVADTGKWLFGRRVLIIPSAVDRPDPERRDFPVALSREQVENSPDIDTDKPVSRQQEASLHGYYGWPGYWVMSAADAIPPYDGGRGDHPETGARAALEKRIEEEAGRGDFHLRSAQEVSGHYISARNGGIGHVDDFLIDEKGWSIRYLVVDTRNWLPGKRVIISPHWVLRVDWSERKVDLDLTQEQIRNSPEYDPAVGINRDYENRLHDYYDRKPYWEDRPTG